VAGMVGATVDHFGALAGLSRGAASSVDNPHATISVPERTAAPRGAYDGPASRGVWGGRIL